MGSPTVWAIDDSENILEILRWYVERNGFSFKEVTDSEQAISRMKKESEPGDLFLVDYKMDAKSGLDLCKELRTMEKHEDAPIYLVSAYLEPETLDEAACLNVTCIPKDTRTIGWITRAIETAGHRRRWLATAWSSVCDMVALNRSFLLFFACVFVALLLGVAIGLLPLAIVPVSLAIGLGVAGALVCFRLARDPSRDMTATLVLYAACMGFLFEVLVVLVALAEALRLFR